MSIYAPGAEQDAQSVVAEAAARRRPLSLVGGGTKADIGRPAQTEATLSAAGLTGVTLYESAEMVIGARRHAARRCRADADGQGPGTAL